MTQEITIVYPWDDSDIKAFEVKFHARRHEPGEWELIRTDLMSLDMQIRYHVWVAGNIVTKDEVVRLPIDRGWLTVEARKYVEECCAFRFWDDAEVRLEERHQALVARTIRHHQVTITTPVAESVRAGWVFSAYQSPDTWQVWAKHPLGGACMIAELPRIGRTGFDVKATAEFIADVLNQREEDEQVLGPSVFIPKREEDYRPPLIQEFYRR